MKIISLTPEELQLKEDGVAGIVIGSVMLGVGLLVAAILSQAGAFGILIGLLFACIGAGFLLFSSSISVIANRRTGQLWYQKKRLTGTQASVYNMGDVACVETRWNLVEQTSTDSDNYTTSRRVLVSKSLIVLRDGRTLPLTHQKNAVRMATPPMILQVAQFLNVPFRETNP